MRVLLPTVRLPIPAPLLVMVCFAFLLLACERVEIDPSVADRPMPTPGAPLDTALAEAGGRLYQSKCAACHSLDGQPLVGPPLGDVTERRSYDWIRGIVMNPDSMLRTDSAAQALLETYQVPMIDTELDEPGFRAVLEFLRGSAR